MTARAIHSSVFLQSLIDAGIIPQREVRRVIIDAQAGDVVRLYVECFGADDLLELIVPANGLDGAKVTVLEGKNRV